ncbi:hypothetical protein OIU84_009384 [Salix udensis]|uniref:Proline-rich protein n=1 Tax=Salix udensis TaxID=889485 RepID=A0AAD6NYQ3_9ROSI|nr:hypothetical protein OIU84_009384 [Salix udensis]
MRIVPVFRGALLCFHVSLVFAAAFCYADDSTVEVIGMGECADCAQSNVKTAHAFSGLKVTIDCKPGNGEFKTRGVGELDEEGKFRVSLPNDVVKDGRLKEECYAQLHSASAAPCPVQNGLASSKIVFKSKTDEKHTFGLAGKLKFSPATCTSAILWPPIYKKPLPPIYKPKPPVYKLPPVPIYKPKPTVYKFPPVPIYKPKPPVYKFPPVPIYKPKPPVYKFPPVPIYKPKPPVYKFPPVPIYKPEPKPPVYKPKPKPPVYKPTPVPIYKPEPKPPIYKPLPPPIPIYKPLPPSIPIYKPLPPPVPIYKPLPPIPKIPPFS